MSVIYQALTWVLQERKQWLNVEEASETAQQVKALVEA